MKKVILCMLILYAAFALIGCDDDEVPEETTTVDEVIEAPLYGGALSTVIPDERIVLYQSVTLRYIGPAGTECLIMTEAGMLSDGHVGNRYDYRHMTHNDEVIWNFDYDESESPFYVLAVSYTDGNVTDFSLIEAEIKRMTNREIHELQYGVTTGYIYDADEERTVAELSIKYRGVISNADGDEREYVLERVCEVIGREWRGEYYTYSDYAEYAKHIGDTDKNDYPDVRLEIVSAAESIDDPAGAVIRFTAPDGVTCRMYNEYSGILTFGNESGISFTLAPDDEIRWEPFADREWESCLPFDTELDNDTVDDEWYRHLSPYLTAVYSLDGDPFGFSVVSAYPNAEGGMTVRVFDGDAIRRDMNNPVHYYDEYIRLYLPESIEEWEDRIMYVRFPEGFFSYGGDSDENEWWE